MADAPTWDEVEVGMTVGPYEVEITPALVEAYCAALPVEPSTYLRPADGGAAFMPPMLPAAWYIHLLKGRLHLAYGLMARHSMQGHRAVGLGERLTATGELVEKYERKGRHYWTLRYEMRNAAGELCQTHTLNSTVD